MVSQDDREKTDDDVAKIEYAMSFYDGDAVRKVRQQRELEKYKPSDSEFSGQLQRMFGRGLPAKKENKKEDLDQIKVVK